MATTDESGDESEDLTPQSLREGTWSNSSYFASFVGLSETGSQQSLGSLSEYERNVRKSG